MVMNDWHHINLAKMARLIHGTDVPKRLRWRWHRSRPGISPALQIISPRGVAWDFRLRGGAWIRKSHES
jgi:hypothetical protein